MESLKTTSLALSKQIPVKLFSPNTLGSFLSRSPRKFLKLVSVDRLKPNGTDFKIPWHAADGATVHEVELGVILNGVKAHEGTWIERIGAYVLLLDMGDFTMIKTAITNGQSWTISKQQDNFLILGDLIPKEAIPDPHNVDLLLKINGEIR